MMPDPGTTSLGTKVSQFLTKPVAYLQVQLQSEDHKVPTAMTNVLEFLTAPRSSAVQKPAPDGECEIVIFPGVRRERCEGSFKQPARASSAERSV